MRNIIFKGTIAGIAGGLILGFFLKWMEALTGVRVYTLLLNVDYIPIINFKETGDFLLHLLVSVPLAIVLLWIVRKKGWEKGVVCKMVVASIIVGVLLYPLTLLSERTPSISSIQAIVLWLIGHGIYGMVLGLFYKNEIE
ncbi:hypothetical protein QR721_03385 [Aciduricibacillus chroicocephali]|uniref:DUF1440 domain-containing protein n=1 Tax=Aciduricibacillus chroicocephali TaxID=3054939 RepID=A0ABY9KWY3_9BACI|nr:hypothetical protein QR721_03385 [Bacillaceae bacterium 44XB]